MAIKYIAVVAKNLLVTPVRKTATLSRILKLPVKVNQNTPDCSEKREVKQIKTMRKLNRYTRNISKVSTGDFHIIKVQLSNINIDRITHGEVNEVSKNNPKKKLGYTLRYSGKHNYSLGQITSLSTIAKLLHVFRKLKQNPLGLERPNDSD
ncbi:hypothetical protein [Desulfotruncus arcticus]|uniref:hypothetical protein n=1 Tax=Desulfotruncus arcticus TaxID=341036 RepID=UPI0010422B7B|nr:hypothetical protein [Desulfotruncus arcticus]